MSVHLAPVVAKKLDQFRRRRLMLILARGICSGVIAFLISFSIVSIIDWYWLLEDQVRWFLSGAAYACVALAVWLTCLRRMIHLPAVEEIASQMEMTEPELRENLLSAVELATDDPEKLNDSPVFRSLLQGKVAEQMTHVRVGRLLPVKLVAKWLVAAVILFAVAALLLTSGDPRFRQLATRAILPGANLARVSRIHVEVLTPSPQSQMIAEDETVAVSVAVTGGSVNEVILESFTEQDGAVQRTMLGHSESEYVANLHVGNESVEYRILAGDAVTQRFRLEAKPRPHVVAFQKKFNYPDYAQLPAKEVTENHGDLLALNGTNVDLVMQLDQDVSKAELQIDLDDSDEIQTIPLTKLETQSDPMLWSASVPIEKAAIYKVHLVSKETGFENIFTPRYEIRPEADLIPKAGFVDQQETTLLLPPSDILGLKGIAEDDLPLVDLQQQFSVNGRDWESIALPTEVSDDSEGRQLTAAWQWDLLDLKLKAGDQVLTKLVATDRKGHLGESIPLRIVVAAQDFDPDRHQMMEQKAALFDELRAYEELLADHKSTALEVLESLRDRDVNHEESQVDRQILIDLADKQQEQASYLLAKIKDVLQPMPAGADAYELDLIGRVMSRLQREYTSLPRFLLKQLQLVENERDRTTHLEQLKKSYSKAADDAKHIAEYYQQFIAHNVLVAIAFDLDAILKQQRLVAESPTQSWDRLIRQETIVLNQLEALERLIQNQNERMPKSLDYPLSELLKWGGRYRQRFQDSMESEDQLTELQKTSKDFYQELQHKQQYASADGGLPGRLVNARRDLDNRAGNLYVPLEHLSRAVHEENKLLAKAIDSGDSAASQESLNEAQRFVTEIDMKLLPTIEQLRDRRSLTQTRPDSDAQYAADAGLTSRAVQFLMGQHREISPVESTLHDALREITFAFRTLEAGHEFAATRIGLEGFANKEQWDSQKITGRLDHPRQWEFIEKAFELTSQRLREADVEREILQEFDELRWSAAMRDAGHKIGERRWRKDLVVGAGHEVVEIRDRLISVDTKLQPVMAEARAIIAKYAPTIPQMAKQTADQLREFEEETTKAADKLEKPTSPEDQEAELAALEEQQDQINQQLEDLMEALVEDANTQDLVNEEQRERARDADDSIAMLEEPAKQMNRELQAAADSPTAEQKAQELAQAAEEQEKTAQALDLIAEHFDRLEQNMDVAESREQLRQTERDLGIARQMDQRFDQSEQLEQKMNQNADDLLAELTEELQSNPAMQQALSEIAKNTLEDAKSTLEAAAQDDQNIQRANEKSDIKFQAKKKELSEALRRMGTEASKLSQNLLNEAKYAASQGQAEEAQQKINAAQQKLNDVASKALATSEDQLLADIAANAQNAQQQLAAAIEDLKSAEELTESSKNESVHQDDNQRDSQKKNFEKRQQQFHEQQKRLARDLANQLENNKKQADQQVRNQENQVRNTERQKQQAQRNLDRKPEDQNLQRNLQQADAKLENEKQKLDIAKNSQQSAEAAAKEAKQKSDQTNSKKLPSLDAKNPASQLADRYTEEGIQAADELKQIAEQVAAESNFGEELTPTRDQLASSQREQTGITEDVQQAADDVARAARHEERLQNATAAAELSETAEAIADVAQGESKAAEQQLAKAASAAEESEPQGNQSSQASTAQGQQAQAAVAQAEAALSQQAEQLENAMQPLLADGQSSASEAAAAQSPPEATGEPTSEGTSENSPGGDGPSQESQASSGTPQPPGEGGDQPSPPQFSAEEMARGEQLARTLDELDRQMASASSSPSEDAGMPPTSPSQPQNALPTLAQAAKAQQSQIATARAQQQQAATMAMTEGDSESEGIPPATGALTDFNVSLVNRRENADWGKLRSKSAEELSKAQTQGISEEYRKSVETYFRVLSERARKK